MAVFACDLVIIGGRRQVLEGSSTIAQPLHRVAYHVLAIHVVKLQPFTCNGVHVLAMAISIQ